MTSEKIKTVLFASTTAMTTTGYSRIAHVLLTHLASKYERVVHFSFQAYPYYLIPDRALPPNVVVEDCLANGSPDGFGIEMWDDCIRTHRPDLIFIYNDSVICCRLFNAMLGAPKPCRVIVYLDVVYDFQRRDFFDHVFRHADHVYVLSEHWKKHLADDLGYPAEKLTAFPHGVDTKRFFVVDRAIARQKLGLPAEGFLVLATSRNSYRKGTAWIAAFLLFWDAAGRPDDVKLVINCRFDVLEFDIVHVISSMCLRYGLPSDLVLNSVVLKLGDRPGLLSDDVINLVQNACDIGINLCGGEGFGLPAVEGGFLGKPQIVTDTGGLADSFREFPEMLVRPSTYFALPYNIDIHGGDLQIVDPERAAPVLRRFYDDPELVESSGRRLREHVAERFAWPKLLDAFQTSMDAILHAPLGFDVFYINLPDRTDRRSHMDAQLQGSMVRVEAVPDRERPHVGCMLSHRRAMDLAAAQSTKDYCVILEDDVVLPPRFLETLEDLATKRLPMGWDCCQLHVVSPGLLRKEPHGRRRVMRGYLMSAAATLWTRAGLRKVTALLRNATFDHPKARAEEMVYGYVNAYTLSIPLVRTDESFGSDIDEIPELNATNAALVPVTDTEWMHGIGTLPEGMHYVDAETQVRRVVMQTPSVVVVVPGFGEPGVADLKGPIFRKNAKILDEAFGKENVRYLAMAYDAKGWQFLSHACPGRLEVRKGKILGSFLADLRVPPCDLVIMMLDDVEMHVPDPLALKAQVIRSLEHVDIVGLGLDAASKCVYEYMRTREGAAHHLRTTGALEFFWYAMTAETYDHYRALLSPTNEWMWGVDLVLGYKGLRTGLLERFAITHHLSGVVDRLRSREALMQACEAYVSTKTGKSVEEIWRELDAYSETLVTFP